MKTILDIVVVSYNTRELLLSCLTSIRVYTQEPHHVYIVDNGSRDQTVSALEALQWDGCTVIANQMNTGYAKACNQGIRAGESPYILLLNSDVLMTPGWLPPLLACMESDPRIAVVGPKMIDQHGRITGAGVVGNCLHHEPRGYMQLDAKGLYENQEDCFSVCGAAYLIRRDYLGLLGLFDENYFFYFEETDYSLKAHTLGFRVVYCPSSRLYHLAGQSNQNHDQLRRYFETSERYFRRKWAHVMRAERRKERLP